MAKELAMQPPQPPMSHGDRLPDKIVSSGRWPCHKALRGTGHLPLKVTLVSLGCA